ncbi:MAG: hypothetical protein LR015_14160 [Verrucomicrobia bacterium]|nr:hypothetical protein [Verrucomicrobiota bacterium]
MVENVGFISKLEEQVKQRAELSLSGITDYTTWSYVHPDSGQELVGVVRMWSPRTQDSARALRDFKPDTTDRAAPASAPARRTLLHGYDKVVCLLIFRIFNQVY